MVDPNILAAVMIDNEWGFINQSGEFAFEAKFPQAHNFSNGQACVNIGGQRLNETSGVVGGKYTFTDKTGKIMGWQFDAPAHFYEGHAAIKQQGFHFIIKTDEAMLNSTFDIVGRFDGGLAPAQYRKENKIGYIDYFGVYKIPTDPNWLIFPFSEGLAKVKVNGKWGYMNQNGEMVIDPIFEDAYSFSEGLATVFKEQHFGFIDTRGNVVIPPKFEDAADFKEGLAAVFKDGLWGFSDVKGNVVIDYQFTNVRSFSEGLAAVQKDGKVGYIDRTGTFKIPPKFEAAYDYSKGMAVFQKDNKMGYLDKNGDVVIDAIFTRASRFVNIDNSNIIEAIN